MSLRMSKAWGFRSSSLHFEADVGKKLAPGEFRSFITGKATTTSLGSEERILQESLKLPERKRLHYKWNLDLAARRVKRESSDSRLKSLLWKVLFRLRPVQPLWPRIDASSKKLRNERRQRQSARQTHIRLRFLTSRRLRKHH